MNAEVRTQVVKQTDESGKVLKELYNVFIMVGDEEVKISSGESTVKKLREMESKIPKPKK